MKKLALFASGNGSNVENIIQYFEQKSLRTQTEVYCNNVHAKVLDKAKNFDVPALVFNKEELQNGFVLERLLDFSPDIIVLAGFLLKFPESILLHFPEKVINIHPALLPKYGGKGMYGNHVHQAVLDNNEKETGITIHYVNERYDEGAIIFQAQTDISSCETTACIADKVHALEMKHFPEIIEKLLEIK
jgi:phosphoribosylglycinamide formyltransferase 1